MINFQLSLINKINDMCGSPVYVFDEDEFVANYRELESTFHSYYPSYHIAYSFKTNYTPYIAKIVKNLGGYAEVVSGMEYYIAKRIGYSNDKIIFNGPDKGVDGITAFLEGSIVNVDSLSELSLLCKTATSNQDRDFKIGLRVNLDVGQDFISRFGIDIEELDLAFEMVSKISNLKVSGLHCHISRCRGIEAWHKRTKIMLELADHYFDECPEYIDLGSGMFGSMSPEFAAQFENVPTYDQYASTVAAYVAEHYKESSKRPRLFTEPGTTLINRFIYFIGRIDSIKTVRSKTFAILNCSIHNLGETCQLKQLPIKVIPCGTLRKEYHDVDLTGYTCLEQDIMRHDYSGEIAVGDYIVYENVGGYSNVLKPPFISPNCAMIAIKDKDEIEIIKHKESYDDILHTYVF